VQVGERERREKSRRRERSGGEGREEESGPLLLGEQRKGERRDSGRVAVLSSLVGRKRSSGAATRQGAARVRESQGRGWESNSYSSFVEATGGVRYSVSSK